MHNKSLLQLSLQSLPCTL